jgi:regulator of nonsense transcripts 2
MDSAIAVNSRTYQLQNKAEQEQLKRLVLQNERRQEQSEKQGESSCHVMSVGRVLIAL